MKRRRFIQTYNRFGESTCYDFDQRLSNSSALAEQKAFAEKQAKAYEACPYNLVRYGHLIKKVCPQLDTHAEVRVGTFRNSRPISERVELCNNVELCAQEHAKLDDIIIEL